MWGSESFSDLKSVQGSADLVLFRDEEAIGDGAGPTAFFTAYGGAGRSTTAVSVGGRTTEGASRPVRGCL